MSVACAPFTSRLTQSESSRRWMALRTRSRQEKAVGRCAEALALNYYLPLMKRVTIVRRRKMLSEVPVFPGYVFVIGERDEVYEPALSARICQIIPIPDQRQFEQEIAQIQRVLSDGVPVVPHDGITPGRRCRVTKGPLVGLEGIVEQRRNRGRLVLQIDSIGKGIALEIERDLLEPIESEIYRQVS